MVLDKRLSQTKNTKTYPTLTPDNKTAKTNADKAELFAESVERHFGIEYNNSDDTNLSEINQFVKANSYIFIPLDSTNDGIHDKDNNHSLVVDGDPKELINIAKFDLRKGKAPGHDTITHELLRLAIRTPFYIHLAQLFTFSLRIGYIPTAWKLATLCMLIKPDKPLSLTTSCRPISLPSTIMKQFLKGSSKSVFENTSKTPVFLVSISQVLGRPNQQMIILSTCHRLL